MFNFLKYAVFYSTMLRSGVHLIYQRNLEFHTPTNLGNFEIGLFKAELYMFEDLQKYLSTRYRLGDLGINWLQFAAWFQYTHHYVYVG